MIRKELGFSKPDFQALSWANQRMYIEQLSIFIYRRDWNNWDQLPEEEKWKYDEPVKPQVLVDEEHDYEEEQQQIVVPDILSG